MKLEPKVILREHRGLLATSLVTLVLTLVSLSWMGFDLTRLGSALIDDRSDPLLNRWAIYQAIDNLIHHPFHLGYAPIFHGSAQPFGYTIAPYGIALFALPIYLLSLGNLTLTYNLYLVATFVLTAAATYGLVRYLFRAPRVVGALMGWMVAFSPVRYVHILHIDTLSMQWYILSLYCLHRLLDAPTRARALLLAAALWLSLQSSAYLGMITILHVAMLLLYLLIRRPGAYTRALLTKLGIAALAFGAASVPFVAFRLGNEAFRRGIELSEMRRYASTPATWFSSGALIYRDLNPSSDLESTIFLGFTPLLLALLAVRFRGAPTESPSDRAIESGVLGSRDWVVLYAIATAAGFVLTLGPVLALSDKLVIPLPYMVLAQFPGFGSLRVPSRYVFLALAGTAILGAYLLTLLSRRADRRVYAAGIAAVALCLFVESVPYNGENKEAENQILHSLQLTSGPLTIKDVPVDTVLITWLRSLPRDTVIFHFPLNYYVNTRYTAQQPLHGLPMLNGEGSLAPDWTRQFDWNNVFPDEATIAFLKRRSVRYVLLHTEFIDEAAGAPLKQRLEAYQSSHLLPPVGQYGPVVAFELR